jgi:NADPH:quinone reductase-like Zn-dependent oxidoreductase
LVDVEAVSFTSIKRRRRIDQINADAWLGSRPLPGYGIAGRVVDCDPNSRFHVGDRVLINGASGGIGSLATQIAKCRGAHVTAVASAANESFCEQLGADELISYQDMNFTWHGKRWDFLFDFVGKTKFCDALDVLEQDGR